MSLANGVRMLCLAALVAGPLACRSLGPDEPSLVAQGRYFATGHPSYDEFFVRLHRLQVELHTAPEEVARVRRELARTLKLPDNAVLATLETALESRAREAERRGVALGVKRDRGEGRTSLTVAGAPGDEDQPLIGVLSDAFVRLERVRQQSKTWPEELEWLPSAGVELDRSVDAAFVGESRGTRDDVRENLADAQKLLALMKVRAEQVEREEDRMRELLANALGTTAPPPPADPPSEAPQAKAPPRRARPAPAPAPATAPAPEKPKRGPAKPDFEP